MHVILHSFTYPLKPLTQAPMSIQPIPILHATHNHVLPIRIYRIRTSSAVISPGHIASGIPPPPFHPDISHPDSSSRQHSTRTYRIRIPLPANIPPRHITSGILPSAIPPGHIASGIPPSPFHPNISHPEFLFPPPFHPDISHPNFLFPSTFHPGHITSGILLCQHSIRISHTRNSVC